MLSKNSSRSFSLSTGTSPRATSLASEISEAKKALYSINPTLFRSIHIFDFFTSKKHAKSLTFFWQIFALPQKFSLPRFFLTKFSPALTKKLKKFQKICPLLTKLALFFKKLLPTIIFFRGRKKFV